MMMPCGRLPDRIRIRDMTLRDGLQSLPITLPTDEKIRLFDGLLAAGVQELQVASFVNPARVPQMADAEPLWSRLAARQGEKSVLVANWRGFERAVAAGCPLIEAVVSVSEWYNEKNAHRSSADLLAEISRMAGSCRGQGRRLGVGLANSFHCMAEGRIAPGKVMDLVARLSSSGVSEISLCDTTGHAAPDHVFDLCAAARRQFPGAVFGAHLHDTRGRGLANAMAALHAGIGWFDATLAGLGGSPFLPGAGGNLSLEAFADMLETMGVATGLDVPRLFDLGAELGRRRGPLAALAR